MKKTILVWCAVVLSVNVSVAQDVYLSSRHEVYSFLKRMETRRLLQEYRDAAKPLSRKTIATFLNELNSGQSSMTELEKETYQFFLGEFSYELSLMEHRRDSTAGRSHLLSTPLFGGVMYADPNLEVGGKSSKEGDVYTWSYGITTYGYIEGEVGYYFDFTLTREGGPGKNPLKVGIPDPGIVVKRDFPHFLEYNSTDAQVTFGWKDVRFSLEKMHNVWGLGRRGSLILSDKAPSYPQIKLRVPVAEWMDFIYLHGDLHSNLVDSARSYRAHSSQVTDFFRTVYRSKYIAAHQIEFTPLAGLDISFGESIVYSDKNPQFIYLIPIMFFKSAEHYNRDTDNAQMFASVDVNLIPNVNTYFSLFIDEINTEQLTDSVDSRNQIGFTAGAQLYDLGIENSELLVEYTRLNPWTYSHKFPAVAFTNNGYDLGHWIGQNSDHLYVEAAYRFSRPLRVGGFFERVRQGGSRDIVGQYTPPSEPFLYGPVRRATSFGLTGDYQFMRDGFLSGSLRWNTVSDEADPSKDRTRQLDFFLRVKYGL